MPHSSSLQNLDSILSLYKTLLSSDFGVWMWEPEAESLYFNTLYMKMLGYSHTDFPFHISTWEQLIHPEDRDAIVSEQRKFIVDPSLGDSFESRFRMRAASGEYMRILGKGFILCRDEQGKALRIAGMHIDMKTLEETLEHLATENDRMHVALEAAHDGLWDWNAETGDVYYSPRYIAMGGYLPEQFPPKVDSWSSRVHPEDLGAVVHKQYAHIANPAMGDLFECLYRFLAADGTYKWILGRGKVTRRDASGKGTRIVGLHTDVTELRATQDKLSQLLNLDALTRLYSRYFFDAVLNTLQAEDTPVSIIFGDLDGLKLINDNLGHATGDKLLIAAADILHKCVGRNAVTARLGGDEFAILLRACPEDKAQDILERIEDATTAYNSSPDAIPVFLSLGLHCATGPICPASMLTSADKAMLQSKARRRENSHARIRKWIETQTGKQVCYLTDARLS